MNKDTKADKKPGSESEQKNLIGDIEKLANEREQQEIAERFEARAVVSPKPAKKVASAEEEDKFTIAKWLESIGKFDENARIFRSGIEKIHDRGFAVFAEACKNGFEAPDSVKSWLYFYKPIPGAKSSSFSDEKVAEAKESLAYEEVCNLTIRTKSGEMRWVDACEAYSADVCHQLIYYLATVLSILAKYSRDRKTAPGLRYLEVDLENIVIFSVMTFPIQQYFEKTTDISTVLAVMQDAFQKRFQSISNFSADVGEVMRMNKIGSADSNRIAEAFDSVFGDDGNGSMKIAKALEPNIGNPTNKSKQSGKSKVVKIDEGAGVGYVRPVAPIEVPTAPGLQTQNATDTLRKIAENQQALAEEEEIRRANLASGSGSKSYLANAQAYVQRQNISVQKMRNFSDLNSGPQTAENIASSISDHIHSFGAADAMILISRGGKIRFGGRDGEGRIKEYFENAKRSINNARAASGKVVNPISDYRIITSNYDDDMRALELIEGILQINPKAKWDHVFIAYKAEIEAICAPLLKMVRPRDQKLYYNFSTFSSHSFEMWDSEIAARTELGMYLIFEFYKSGRTIDQAAKQLSEMLSDPKEVEGMEMVSLKSVTDERERIVRCFHGSVFMDPSNLTRTVTYKKSIKGSNAHLAMVKSIIARYLTHIKIWDKVNQGNRYEAVKKMDKRDINLNPDKDFFKYARGCFIDNKTVLRLVKLAIRPIQRNSQDRNIEKVKMTLEDEDIQHLLDDLEKDFDDESKDYALQKPQRYNQRSVNVRVKPKEYESIYSEENDDEDESQI